MNTVPPGILPGQAVQYPRISIKADANDRERWKRLQASEAKIVAYTVANHVYKNLRVRAFHDRLEASWMVVNDHNYRAFARDFVEWDLGDLMRDFEASSFTSGFEILSRSVGALVETVSLNVPGVRRRLLEGLVLTRDRKTIWCALAATRCRRELGDATSVMRHHHARARTGRAALAGSSTPSAESAKVLEHIEVVQESSKAAHAGIMRAMRYIQQRTESTYSEEIPLIVRLLCESAVVDWAELCSAHLEDTAKRLRGLLDGEPEMREELLALGLDPEMQALVSTCAPRRAVADGTPLRSTTLKMGARKTTRSRAH